MSFWWKSESRGAVSGMDCGSSPQWHDWLAQNILPPKRIPASFWVVFSIKDDVAISIFTRRLLRFARNDAIKTTHFLHCDTVRSREWHIAAFLSENIAPSLFYYAYRVDSATIDIYNGSLNEHQIIDLSYIHIYNYCVLCSGLFPIINNRNCDLPFFSYGGNHV